MTTAIGYLRCSTTQQLDSIPVQHGLIATSAARFGYTLADRESMFTAEDCEPVPVPGCFHDYGVSASKVPFAQRESVAAMLEYMAARDIRTIVAAKMTRVFRNARDCMDTVEKFQKSGLRIIVLDFLGGQALDTSSATSKLMLQLLAAVNEYESDIISERVAENIAHRKKQGRRTGEIPYGSRLPEDPADDRLIPHPVEQRILHRLLRGDLAHRSSQDCQRILNAEGVPAKKGGRWYASSIDSVKEHGRLFEPAPL